MKNRYKKKWDYFLGNRAVCYTIGFGATTYRKDNYSHLPVYEKPSEYMKVHKVRLMTYKDCNYYFPFKIAYVEKNDFICVESANKKHGLCEGDSGSPLVCDKYLFGIFTSSEDCGERGVPQIFINVVKVLNELPSVDDFQVFSGSNLRRTFSFKMVVLAIMTILYFNQKYTSNFYF
ncbi:transmembrane protease serine 13-like isoform X2 [Cimex lectularius]|nr:transmembrane protease serine 13-like isoform X2 [Cimex lectularius]